MNYLSLAAMVRNEALYLEEWVRYHHMLGFERFYIYENDSTDNTVDVLEYLSTLYPITWSSQSGKAIVKNIYEHCVQAHKKDSRWILFADIDEFVVPLEPLHDFLKDYEKYPGLTVHWFVFGSNGHLTYTNKPVIRRFTKRASKPHICCKTFVDPVRTGKCYTSHRFEHTSHPVDEHFVPITTAVARTDKITCDLIQLNHYATKSYEECMKRRITRRLSTGEPHGSAEKYFRNHDINEVEDTSAPELWDTLERAY